MPSPASVEEGTTPPSSPFWYRYRWTLATLLVALGLMVIGAIMLSSGALTPIINSSLSYSSMSFTTTYAIGGLGVALGSAVASVVLMATLKVALWAGISLKPFFTRWGQRRLPRAWAGLRQRLTFRPTKNGPRFDTSNSRNPLLHSETTQEPLRAPYSLSSSRSSIDASKIAAYQQRYRQLLQRAFQITQRDIRWQDRHYKEFRNLQRLAQEKVTSIDKLPASGGSIQSLMQEVNTFYKELMQYSQWLMPQAEEIAKQAEEIAKQVSELKNILQPPTITHDKGPTDTDKQRERDAYERHVQENERIKNDIATAQQELGATQQDLEDAQQRLKVMRSELAKMTEARQQLEAELGKMIEELVKERKARQKLEQRLNKLMKKMGLPDSDDEEVAPPPRALPQASL